MTAPLPLADLRILALTQLGVGPYAMQVLGDLGAEIVKIEDPINS
jgi:crotonobetainyl-CoA:carnitine CoA-transferase CaiB-like acyl-CoA transferase